MSKRRGNARTATSRGVTSSVVSPIVNETATVEQNEFEIMRAELVQLRSDCDLLRRQSVLNLPSATVTSGEQQNYTPLSSARAEQSGNETLRMSLTEARTLIPIFEPGKYSTTAEDWISTIETLKNIYRWDSLATMFYAGSQLRGAANEWYEVQRKYLLNWEQFKTNLVSGFPTVENHSDILNRLMKRQRHYKEEIEMYFYSVVGLCNKLKMNDAETIRYVISGLNNKELIFRLEAAKPITLEQTLKEIKVIESMNDHMQIRKQFQPNADPEKRNYTDNNKQNQNSNSNNYHRPLKRTFEYYQNNNSNITTNNNRPPFKRNFEQNRSYNFQQNKYQPYQQNTSRFNNVMKPTNNNAPNIKSKQCYRCGKIGHLSYDCFKQQKFNTDQSTKIRSIKNTNENVNECYQVIKVGEVELNAFLDLGSDCTTMQASVANDLKWNYDGNNTILKGFGGGSYKSRGSLNKIIEINNVKLLTDIMVVDDKFQDVPVLVGRNFLNHPSVMVIKRYGTLIVEKDVKHSEHIYEKMTKDDLNK